MHEKNRQGSLTVVVGADLQGLVPAHHQTSLLVLLVLQQPHVAGTTLLPLLALTVVLEQLGAHLEHLLLKLLVGLGLHLLGEADDGLEVNFGGFGGILFLLNRNSYQYIGQNNSEK